MTILHGNPEPCAKERPLGSPWVSDRVASEVAACGDCNIMKYKWDLEDFLEHCRKVARFHQNTDLADGDAEEEEEAAWQSAIVEDGGAWKFPRWSVCWAPTKKVYVRDMYWNGI